MSTKIYDAFIVKADNPENINTLITIAQDIRKQMLEEFKDRFSEAVLIRMFKAIDLVSFYGENILDSDKFKDENLRSLIKKWIQIKNDPYDKIAEWHLRLWFDAAINMNRSLKELRKEYSDYTSYYRAKIMFIPCHNKTLGMYFGDPSFEPIVFRHKNIKDYHYQNQTDQPEDITNEEWEIRKNDWNEAIGPDYIPMNHGISFQLLDYDAPEEDIIIDKAENYAYTKLDDIKHKRIRNILDTIECPLFPDLTNMSPAEQINTISHIKNTADYDIWKTKQEKLITEKIRICDI